MFITIEDQHWLKENFFKNKFHFCEEKNGYKIKGNFLFSAYFDKDKQGYYLKPDKSCIKDPKFFIKDEYEISLYIPKINTIEDNFYRHVKETEGRIKEVAKRLKNGKNEELHINPNDTLCIIGLFQEVYDIDIKTFMKSTVLQFFYDQSFFALYEKWVRGEYSHGLKGILESYSDQLALTDDIVDLTERCIKELMRQKKYFEILKTFLTSEKKLRGHQVGLSKKEPTKKFRDIIGRKAFDGLWRLKNNLRKYNLPKIQL